MLYIMQIVSMILIAIALAPALAHALEYPGKMRLGKEAYMTVQQIYYPGFTIAGIAEVVGLISILVLLLLTPQGTASFWFTLVAAAGLLAMQLVFWTVTQPVNKVWLQGVTLSRAAGGFFDFDPAGGSTGHSSEADWAKLRDRWEFSHITRAAFVFVSFISLVFAIVAQ